VNKITQKWLNKEQGKILDNKVHYFAASFSHWVTDPDMGKAIKRLRSAMGSGKSKVHVWLVPVPAETPYEIQGYAPQIEEAHLVAEIVYDR